MAKPRILIVGASRGIGLGLAKEFAGRGWRVDASERSRSEELHAASQAADGAIEIVTVDVGEAASVEALAGRYGEGALDALLLNAGIYGPRDQSIAQVTPDQVLEIMMANAVGPAKTAAALLPALRDGGVLAFTTSGMGSIGEASGGAELYRMSKAAQNMLARCISESEAKARGIPVLSLHPGWVRTDMGGRNASIGVEESARGLADVLTAEHQAGHRFLDYRGRELAF